MKTTVNNQDETQVSSVPPLSLDRLNYEDISKLYKREMRMTPQPGYVFCKIGASSIKKFFPSSMVLDTFCIGVVLSGRATISYNRIPYVLNRRDAFFNLWETVLDWKNVSSDFELLLFATDDKIRLKLLSLIDERRFENLLSFHFILEMDEPKKDFLISTMMLLKKIPFTNQSADSCVMGITSLMMQIINDSYDSKVACNPVHENVDYKGQVYRRFMVMLRENCHKERSVCFYANKLCITRRSLSSIIKEVSGVDVKCKIDEFVVMKSKMLLAYSSLSMLQISEELNFTALSAFTIYFKRTTGLSPLEYRKQVRSC